MPLDTLSTYATTHLRLDGRRWNELRNFTASISTQPSADGSSLITMGNTSVVCTITGPREGRNQGDRNNALVETEINIAPFALQDRGRPGGSGRPAGRTDKRLQEIQTTISQTFQSHLFTNLYPRSTILISLTVLSLDGSLLPALMNAASLALVDAGVPMPSILSSISTGIIMPSSMASTGRERPEPVLDLNIAEEQELPFLTVGSVRGTSGSEDMIATLIMESRVQAGDGGSGGVLEVMLGVGLDGCKSVRGRMEDVVRKHGKRVMEGKV